MSQFDRKQHWENIYNTKAITEVSWYQQRPETSLSFIANSQLSTTARIIDIGGGDSFLVDNLLALGYENITVVDISAKALQRAQKRLADQTQRVQWIVTDVVQFESTQRYDLWHDRAAFHFLTDEQEIASYLQILDTHLVEGGYAIIGVFSQNGPQKCSGIHIHQYSAEQLCQLFEPYGFVPIELQYIDHSTPFDTTQNFLFASFRKQTR
ncbi:MAG TPA: class I SAM-dependent methyltransferase [Chitinophagales bacterium]|nr:class I SAM-dependent methyltransferase [Chitinophagales bacterium]